MRKLILFFIGIISVVVLQAQQLPQFSIINEMVTYYNPAFIGATPKSDIGIGVRKQWAAVESSPLTGLINGNVAFRDKNYSMGGYILNDQNGHFIQTALSYGLSYRIALGSGKTKKYSWEKSFDHSLQIGMRFILNHYKLNGQLLRPDQANDTRIINQAQGSLMPDVDLGIAYHYKYLSLGLSVNQLIGLNNQFEVNNQTSNIQRERHYYFYGANTFLLNNHWDLALNGLVKYALNTPVQAELHVKALYDNTFSFGLGYRTLNQTILQLGYIHKGKFGFYYAYDFPWGNSSAFYQTHELQLKYFIAKTGKRPSKS